MTLHTLSGKQRITDILLWEMQFTMA